VWGYVVMPEHFHILISEPAKGNVARVMQVLKQRVSRDCRKKKKTADQMKLWESPPAGVLATARPGEFGRTVALEQLSILSIWRRRAQLRSGRHRSHPLLRKGLIG